MVGFPHQTPDMPSVWPGLTSETSKNHGYSIRSWEIYTQNLDTWLQVHKKQAEVGGQPKEYLVLGSYRVQ